MLGGKLNLGALMKNANKIREMMEKNKEEMARLEIVGESGAGLVTVIMTGLYQIKNIHISDELLKGPKEVIEELIAAAVNSATQKVTQAVQNKMGNLNDLFGGFSDQTD